MTPMSRDEFRESVFLRDNHLCVICKQPAVDAHHILERRLFIDGGYFLDNGASLCEKHHLEAEMTVLSCEQIREAAKIQTIILPDHLYEDCNYDKWGNEILKSGDRIKGELFDDESVQKILRAGNVLDIFINKIKYPRTYHFPWSPGVNRDDRVLHDISVFENQQVVITEKLDGENSTLYSDYYHPRSLDCSPHPSRNWIKNLWAQQGYEIPEGWRVCGENVFQKHAIHYSKENGNALKTYFYMFSIWNDRNKCLSWEETKEWAELLKFELVPVLYEGIWDMNVINALSTEVETKKDTIEGYVCRLAREFHYSEFKKVYAKYVRKNHVQNNHGHWMQQKVIKNEIVL